jgi:hypothetical protein
MLRDIFISLMFQPNKVECLSFPNFFLVSLIKLVAYPHIEYYTSVSSGLGCKKLD